MPILYGLLGSIAFVLRRRYDRLAAHLLSSRDARARSGIRLMLGVLIGGCVGLIFSGTSTAQSTGILGAAATLKAAAIAFLAGYGVERRIQDARRPDYQCLPGERDRQATAGYGAIVTTCGGQGVRVSRSPAETVRPGRACAASDTR